MRIIYICVLIMRMGGKTFGVTVSSTDNLIITTTETTINDEVNRLELESSETEDTSVGFGQLTFEGNEAFKLSPETEAEFISPSLSGLESSHLNESSEKISTLTSQLANPSRSVVSLSYGNATTENAVSDNSKNGSATNALTADALPAKPVKKILQAPSDPKEKRKLQVSPAVLAKKCCRDNHILSQGNCVSSTNPVAFNPQDRNETSPYNFSWETKLLNCPVGFVKKELFLDGINVSLDSNKTDSFLKVKESIFMKEFTEFCIGHLSNGSYAALVCAPDTEKICSTATCVKKCCAANEVMSGFNCERSDRKYSPLFRTLQGEETYAPDDLRVVTEVPSCKKGFPTMVHKPDSFYLLVTGNLYITENGDDVTEYCIEYNEDIKTDIAMYCVKTHSITQQWKITLMPICMMISIVFLFIVILCHLITPVLRNVQGYCFMTYSGSLLLAYSGFYTSFMYTRKMNSSHCVFNGMFSQCLLLSSFFWLSVLCFDIWRVIRASVRGKPLTGILATDGRKFLLYCAYAFGFPLLITLVTLIMQYVPHEYTEGLIVPGFGEESCWFSSKKAQAVYFYSFMLILNCCSLAMLVHIFYLLIKTEEGFTLFFKPRIESRAFNRNHMTLFRQRLGLFIMMSVCWLTEFLSLVIPPIDMWVVTDILNTLQGVIVFLIFVSSRKKRQQVLDVLALTFPCISCKRSSSNGGARTARKRSPTKSDSSGSSSTASTEVESLPSLWLKRIFDKPNKSTDAQQREDVKTQGIANIAYDPGNEGNDVVQCESNL